jgi:excisionase family DNA binding protein
VPDEFLTVDYVAGLLKLNPQTVRNMVDRGQLRAVGIGSRRVRIRRSDLNRFIEAGDTGGPGSERAEAVDEGSVTAWATFGAAMADATATLDRADQVELVTVLERLADATQTLVDSLRAGEA